MSAFVDGGHERQLRGSALAESVYFNGQSVKNYGVVKKSHDTLQLVAATRRLLLMLVGNT